MARDGLTLRSTVTLRGGVEMPRLGLGVWQSAPGEETRRAELERARPQSPLGLIAEDIDPKTKRMWGNFPQAYSHVGLIHAAFAASPPWHDVL